MEGLHLTNDIVVYILGLATVWGSLLWRVAALEKKMDIHNNAVLRLVAVERDMSSVKRRIDEVEGVLPRAVKGD